MATSPLEWTAIVTAVTYVILAAKRMLLCWLFAFISSSLYVLICYQENFYLESFLQVFYVVMAVIGWLIWRKEDRQGLKITVKVWSLKVHALNIVLSGSFALLLGWLFDACTNQSSPYLDAFTTVFSLLATFMVTKGVLENWLYWIAIDLASIPLYASKEYYSSAVLFFVYTVLAVFGFISWYRKYKLQKA